MPKNTLRVAIDENMHRVIHGASLIVASPVPTLLCIAVFNPDETTGKQFLSGLPITDAIVASARKQMIEEGSEFFVVVAPQTYVESGLTGESKRLFKDVNRTGRVPVIVLHTGESLFTGVPPALIPSLSAYETPKAGKESEVVVTDAILEHVRQDLHDLVAKEGSVASVALLIADVRGPLGASCVNLKGMRLLPNTSFIFTLGPREGLRILDDGKTKPINDDPMIGANPMRLPITFIFADDETSLNVVEVLKEEI